METEVFSRSRPYAKMIDKCSKFLSFQDKINKIPFFRSVKLNLLSVMHSLDLLEPLATLVLPASVVLLVVSPFKPSTSGNMLLKPRWPPSTTKFKMADAKNINQI